MRVNSVGRFCEVMRVRILMGRKCEFMGRFCEGFFGSFLWVVFVKGFLGRKCEPLNKNDPW